jgi:phosphonate transport system substrate-binding protein
MAWLTKSLAALLFLFCTVSQGAEAPPAAPPPLVLAVHPYLPSAEIQERFGPLARYLEKITGRKVTVRVGGDYDEHINAIGRDSVDIAFMGPAPYVLLVARYGPKPLLARIEIDGKPYLTGDIITRKDSKLRNLSDLKGKRFAFGDPDSTMSSLVPRYMLQEAGIPLTSLAGYEYLGAHKNVALGVLAGDFDAGAVKSEVFDELAPRGLRVLAVMPMVSEHLFVTRSNMPPAEVERLREALLRLKLEPEGSEIMRSINRGMTGMVPVVDADYQSLRAILKALNALPH